MEIHRPQVVPIRLELERENDIDNLRADPGLLQVGKSASATIGEAHLGDFCMINRVLEIDILGPDDTGHHHFTHFKIHLQFLPRKDNQIAVGQNLSDDGGDRY